MTSKNKPPKSSQPKATTTKPSTPKTTPSASTKSMKDQLKDWKKNAPAPTPAAKPVAKPTVLKAGASVPEKKLSDEELFLKAVEGVARDAVLAKYDETPLPAPPKKNAEEKKADEAALFATFVGPVKR